MIDFVTVVKTDQKKSSVIVDHRREKSLGLQIVNLMRVEPLFVDQ